MPKEPNCFTEIKKGSVVYNSYSGEYNKVLKRVSTHTFLIRPLDNIDAEDWEEHGSNLIVISPKEAKRDYLNDLKRLKKEKKDLKRFYRSLGANI